MAHRYLLIPLLALGLTACATRAVLTAGTYRETRGPGVVLFSDKELRIYPNGRFGYLRSSDMVGSGEHGRGTYELRGRRLRLRFDGQPLEPVARFQARPLPATHPDSLTLTFGVWDLKVDQDVRVPMPGATIIAYDATGQQLAVVPTDAEGRARLSMARSQRPHLVKIFIIGWKEWQQSITGSSTAYEAYLAPNFGSLYSKGTALDFQVARRTAEQLVLRRGQDTITLVLSAPR